MIYKFKYQQLDLCTYEQLCVVKNCVSWFFPHYLVLSIRLYINCFYFHFKLSLQSLLLLYLIDLKIMTRTFYWRRRSHKFYIYILRAISEKKQRHKTMFYLRENSLKYMPRKQQLFLLVSTFFLSFIISYYNCIFKSFIINFTNI